jgi:hypothetical protein
MNDISDTVCSNQVHGIIYSLLPFQVQSLPFHVQSPRRGFQQLDTWNYQWVSVARDT